MHDVLRLHPSALDYAIIAAYFVVVLGIGAVARLSIKTDVDFFLINLWTGLAMLVVAGLMIGWALARPVRLAP
jgi:Na+/proline symporter